MILEKCPSLRRGCGGDGSRRVYVSSNKTVEISLTNEMLESNSKQLFP